MSKTVGSVLHCNNIYASPYMCSGSQVSSAVFCPGFQKGRVPSENGTFSAVNGPSKGHN